MKAQKIVDARGLVPPEPMERALEAVDSLGEDDEVLLLLHREPFPLYNVLKNNGFSHRTELREDGTFEIHITRAQS